jgi:ureidoglycolate hydrolase
MTIGMSNIPWIPLLRLSVDAFAPYGDIIAHNGEEEPAFQVVIDEPEPTGWRIAVNKVTARAVTSLGCHPNTRESFEPLSGVAVIVVAEQESPDRPVAFLLDCPVCLHKGIWHASLALSEFALLKITENHTVQSESYPLPLPLAVGLVQG